MTEFMHPLQIEGFRRMTPGQKLRVVTDLYHAGIQLKVAGLRMVHPDWKEDRLQHEARHALLNAGYRDLFRDLPSRTCVRPADG